MLPFLGVAPIVHFPSVLHSLNHLKVVLAQLVAGGMLRHGDATAGGLQVLLHMVQQIAPQIHVAHVEQLACRLDRRQHFPVDQSVHKERILLGSLLHHLERPLLVFQEPGDHKGCGGGGVKARLKLAESCFHSPRCALSCAVTQNHNGLRNDAGVVPAAPLSTVTIPCRPLGLHPALIIPARIVKAAATAALHTMPKNQVTRTLPQVWRGWIFLHR
mmetsp:Transcript_4518/g.12339  ORF Transcript_4518/g.12339 Transcript_4518/m.12339 type:complete len:216 (-) Transcript_4518:412-1059(-)